MILAIIILTGDTPEVLFPCLLGIKYNTSCKYRIYLGYNGSSSFVKAEIINFLAAEFEKDAFMFISYSFYNFSHLNNDIVRRYVDPQTKHLLFCNNDVIVIDSVIDKMVNVLSANPTRFGTLGCRLLFADKSIQHDGQVIYTSDSGRFRAATHLNFGLPADSVRYDEARSVTGNTFALCLTSRQAFNAIGGLNDSYAKCYEDVEYNLSCLQHGFENVILPSKYWAYHLESYTRAKGPLKATILPEDQSRLECFFNRNFPRGLLKSRL